MQLKNGDIFAEHYQLKKLLGVGSFGEVWLARNILADVDVAIKLYGLLDDNGIKDFREEFKLAYKLHHPNLLHLNHFDVFGQCPFLVMPYCPKGSSASLKGKISEKQIWRFIRDVSCGLMFLHNQNPPIIHQDIKPDNILIGDDDKFIISDFGISRKLEELRSEQDLFCGNSFDTIAGYAAHGAIVHYEPTPETDLELLPQGLLLLDSGAQYEDGTTDITRTIALGPVNEEERHDYTLVLKGHIRLARAKFPQGCSGTQLDACARYAMWQEGINYLHGTGHGVGSCPVRARRSSSNPHELYAVPAPPLHDRDQRTGHLQGGRHGIRIENTQIILPYRGNRVRHIPPVRPAHPLSHRHGTDRLVLARHGGNRMAQPLPQPGVRPTGSVARPRAPHMASRGDLAIRTHKNNS